MVTRLLIVEDDPALRQMLTLHFEDAAYVVTAVATCAEAERAVAAGPGLDLVLLDQQLPDGTGSDLLPRLLAADATLTVVMMTGRHDLELAIEAIGRGAADFIHKPIQTEALEQTVGRLLADRRLARELRARELRAQEVRAQEAGLAAGNSRQTRGGSDAAAPGSATPEPPRDLIGRSAAMLGVSKAIALSARGGATVLITGESGTGKEIVARLIHQHSGVRGAFVAVNCAAIIDTLLESELFGHERGAFTGAQARKTGKLELAANGTLFLDEIGELAPAVQAKLLRALQERRFERVGGTETLMASARIIAATHRNLMTEVAAGRFRADLAYRLRVIELHLPPLRERREDIPLLVDGLLNRIATRLGAPRPVLAGTVMPRLLAHDWPGNVRELENLLTRAAVQARDGVITPAVLGPLDATAVTAVGTSAATNAATGSAAGTGQPRASPPAPGAVAGGYACGHAGGAAADPTVLRSLDAVEAEHIARVLAHTDGHKGQTCEILGISRPALDRKIAKYALSLPERRR